MIIYNVLTRFPFFQVSSDGCTQGAEVGKVSLQLKGNLVKL